MEFLANNKLSKAVLYWRDKTELDGVVAKQVQTVQRKIRSFLNDVRGLLGPAAAIEGVEISTEATAAKSFVEWERDAYRAYDLTVGTTSDPKSLIAVRRRMLGRRLAKLKDVFIETCVHMSAIYREESPPDCAAEKTTSGGAIHDGTLVQLSDALLCSICEDFFSSGGSKAPRTLPCGHTLCSECLSAILARHQSCPTCRAVLIPPTNGVEGFPKNYFIIQLLTPSGSARTGGPDKDGSFKELSSDL